MIDKFFKLLFDKDNLKTNGLIIVIILLITAIMGGGWTYYKIVSNHLEHNNTAILQQAVSNEKVVGALDKLTEVIDRKIK